jgi:hypothetical protein
MKIKTFEIEGLGTVGETNLSQGGFTSTRGKDFRDLEIGERCVGYFNHALYTKHVVLVRRLEDLEGV